SCPDSRLTTRLVSGPTRATSFWPPAASGRAPGRHASAATGAGFASRGPMSGRATVAAAAPPFAPAATQARNTATSATARRGPARGRLGRLRGPVLPCGGGEERALGGRGGDEGRPALAAGEHRLDRGHVEAAAQLAGAVALDAAFRQERPDLLDAARRPGRD